MNKTTLFFFILSIVFASSSVFAYISMGIMIDRVQESTQASLVKTKTLQENESLANRVASSLESNRDNISRLASYLIPDSELVSAVETLESLGPMSNVVLNIQSLTADDASNHTKGTVSLVKARLEARGDWKGVTKFLGLVQNIPYKSSIRNITMRSSEGGVGDDALSVGKGPVATLWTVSFDIDVYKIK